MTDAHREAGSPAPGPLRGRGTRASLTGRALVLALVVVALFLALAVPVRSWFAQRAEIAQLRADVAASQQRVEELRIEQERWEDPAFIAAEARRRLHFVLPGEIGYVALGAQMTQEEAAALASAAAAPWYATLWRAVRQTDDPTPRADDPAAGADKAGAAASDVKDGSAAPSDAGGAGGRGQKVAATDD